MRLAFNLLSAFLIYSFLNTAHADQGRDLYDVCQGKVRAGNYGSSEWQRTCQEIFDMPDAYLVKCATWLAAHNFPSEVDTKACRLYCQQNERWGPWYDFEIPFELKVVTAELRRLHMYGKCLD
jgi:hypothetical protein